MTDMRYVVQVMLLVVATAYAWRRGGLPERAGSLILVAMFAASPIYAWLAGEYVRYNEIDPGYFAIDAICLVLLGHLAMRSDRWWPLWISGAQLIATLSHFVRMLDVTFAPLAYALMMRAPSWLELFILICGTALANPERSRHPGRTKERRPSMNPMQEY